MTNLIPESLTFKLVGEQGPTLFCRPIYGFIRKTGGRAEDVSESLLGIRQVKNPILFPDPTSFKLRSRKYFYTKSSGMKHPLEAKDTVRTLSQSIMEALQEPN